MIRETFIHPHHALNSAYKPGSIVEVQLARMSEHARKNTLDVIGGNDYILIKDVDNRRHHPEVELSKKVIAMSVMG